MVERIAARHIIAVDLLGIAPGDQVLEIGCGNGVATTLALADLRDGHLTAIDRSDKMAAATARRNADAVAAGVLEVMAGDFEDAVFTARFDRIFAVNVDFPRHPDKGWAAKASTVLKAGGTAVLVLEAPTAATAETFGRKTVAALEHEGLEAGIVRRGGIVAVRATGT